MVAEGLGLYFGEKRAEVGAWWQEPALREQLDTEPELGVRRYTDASIFRGFCFLGSGGWAFMQHVVPCVNPLLQRGRNGAASQPQAPFGGKVYRLQGRKK